MTLDLRRNDPCQQDGRRNRWPGKATSGPQTQALDGREDVELLGKQRLAGPPRRGVTGQSFCKRGLLGVCPGPAVCGRGPQPWKGGSGRCCLRQTWKPPAIGRRAGEQPRKSWYIHIVARLGGEVNQSHVHMCNSMKEEGVEFA